MLSIIVDSCIVLNSYTLVSLVLFANRAPLQYYTELLIFLPLAVLIHCIINMKLGLYREVGRYAGLTQAMKIVRASVLTSLLLLIAGVVSMPSSRPHAAALVSMGGVLAFVLMASVRFYPRVFYERSLREIKPRQRMLIVGAGTAGEMVFRDIQRERRADMEVTAFADDNRELEGMEIHGVPIHTPVNRVPEISAANGIDEILIAIPSAGLEDFRRLWKICAQSRLPVKTIRPIQSILFGRVGLEQIKEISIEDLLGRQPVYSDYSKIGDFIKERVVLITGAGGSIGSELAIQIGDHKPKFIVLLDHDESALYHVHEKLSQNLTQNHALSIASVRAEERIDTIFQHYRPQIVFHAAAYKHVPLLELSPDEAVLNNVLGTFNIARMAGVYGCDCFVNISTDKAVEPINVLGATKRLGELITAELGRLYPETKYCSVRFGNVLDSRGSVIPVFREQISGGGPVTVTHPEATRYFMLISEAADLVLQAAAFQEKKAIYVLDMGNPVNILELANQMIGMMRPQRKVDVVFTGLRPGEKVNEKLFDMGEEQIQSEHPRILRVQQKEETVTRILEQLPELFRDAFAMDCQAIRRRLNLWFPTFQYYAQNTKILDLPGRGDITSTPQSCDRKSDSQDSPDDCYSYQWRAAR